MESIFDKINNIEKKDINNFNIENKEIENSGFIVNNELIVNSQKGNLLQELKICLSQCNGFYFSIAFINFSGIQFLLDSFKELGKKGIKGKILTSTYLNFTEPKTLERIRNFSNIDLKVFIANKDKGFHTKAYIFENREEYKIIIGSSNITQRALKSNVEWNVKVVSKKDNSFTRQVLEEYLGLWDSTTIVSDDFLNSYRSFLKEIRKSEANKALDFSNYELIKPNEMQKMAIKSLDRLRDSGENLVYDNLLYIFFCGKYPFGSTI